MKTVHRADILEKLEQWRAGTLSAVDMHQWAAALHVPGNIDFEDWESDRRFSASKEALSELFMLDINLVTKDDVPFFVEFLSEPIGRFEQGYIRFIERLQAIPRAERKVVLKDQEPYRHYCTSKLF